MNENHNGGDSASTSVAAGQMKQIIERIERTNEEIQEAKDGQKEIYAEAKANGFDVKTLRRVVAIRKMDPDARAEEAAMLDLYLSALGMMPHG